MANEELDFNKSFNPGNTNTPQPISRSFGGDRMKDGALPLCWYYIYKFLDHHKNDIKGRVLEIGENKYTKMFGGNRVTQSDVLHAAPGNLSATIYGDLTNIPSVADNTFDCIILTQTLQCIFDVRAAVKEIYRILKPGGTVLVSFAGISQISRYDMDRWGEFWRFTNASALKLFEEHWPVENILVETHGNVKVAQAYLDGLVTSDLNPELLEYTDPDYQMIITLKAAKPLVSNKNKEETQSHGKTKKSDLDLLVSGWDNYAKVWKGDSFNVIDKNKIKFIGDEWTFESSEQANINYGLDENTMLNFDEYISKKLISKYIPANSNEGLEIGPGGGRITQFLIDRTKKLHLTDSSEYMLNELQKRFNNFNHLNYYLTKDGKTLPRFSNSSLDYVISFDVFVHFEPRLVFWYMQQIVKYLKPGGVCVLHYANPHSEIGWKQFKADLEMNLEERKNFASFGLMTPEFMKTFVEKLDCELIENDLTTIPRDSITIFRKSKSVITKSTDRNAEAFSGNALVEPSVLLYHRVADLDYDYNLLAVSPENFEQQLKIIKDNYNPISTTELINKIRNKSLTGNEIVITFDDGYYDNYMNALPLLQKYSVPATIFITSGFINDKKNSWWDELEYIFLSGHNLPGIIRLGDREFEIGTKEKKIEFLNILLEVFRTKESAEISNILKYIFTELNIDWNYRASHRFMTEEEIILLNKSDLITIASHTVTHVRLSMLNYKNLQKEIVQSKTNLENIIGGEVDFFSYPYGTKADYSADSVELIKSSGYEAAFSNYPGKVSNDSGLFELPRYLVRNWNGAKFDQWLRSENKTPFEVEEINKRKMYFV